MLVYMTYTTSLHIHIHIQLQHLLNGPWGQEFYRWDIFTSPRLRLVQISRPCNWSHSRRRRPPGEHSDGRKRSAVDTWRYPQCYTPWLLEEEIFAKFVGKENFGNWDFHLKKGFSHLPPNPQVLDFNVVSSRESTGMGCQGCWMLANLISAFFPSFVLAQ